MAKSAPDRQPINFLDSSLARSVIARPLQELIERELDATARMRTKFPDLASQFKTAIFLNPDFYDGLVRAREEVKRMLRTIEEGRNTSGKRTIRAKLDGSMAKDLLLGTLDSTVVDHLKSMNEARSSPILQIWPSRWDVIIDINLKFRDRQDYTAEGPAQIAPRGESRPFETDPRLKAKRVIREQIELAKQRCGVTDPTQGVETAKTELSSQYVFARLESSVVIALANIDKERGDEWADMEQFYLQKIAAHQAAGPRGGTPSETVERPNPTHFRAIHRIWPDFDLHRCTHRSVRTVKADAAQNSFSAFGEGVTWAVIDSGIDWRHPHFAMHANIDPQSPFHRDFTSANERPLVDDKGHGTHVAGIIAGQQIKAVEPSVAPMAPYDGGWRLNGVQRELDASNVDEAYASTSRTHLASIAGIAPKCKLVSLKVLDQFGNGKASSVIAAIAHIQLINGHGRDLKIHGVNLSLGHNFDAKWFACGHSPLCTEVNRLVKSGVVVVVAAGNTGYGVLKSLDGDRNSGLDLSINDPGNAELAITVGATHRDSPHTFGVSYFSSKGPTGDGRCKPDLIAPGERIISAAAVESHMAAEFGATEFAYFESSGTSMAAPHVSGAIAAFLSIRSEFIGEAEKIKKIFTSTATDLGRERYFQGAGLVDLLRAIQSV